MTRTRRWILGAALAWAAVVGAAAYAAVAIHGGRASVRGHWDPSLDRYAKAAPLARWDSYWYWRIAERGYEWADDGRMHTVAFFPLYPATLAAVFRAVGLHPFLSGEGISLAALVAAAFVVARYAGKTGFDPRCSVAALLLYPKAMFFLAVYAEATFLLCSAACLLAIREDRPGRAAVWGALAGLARPTGVVLALPILWAAWEGRRDGRAGRLGAAAVRLRIMYCLAAIAPIAGAACFGAYLWSRFGSPLVGVRAESVAWGNRPLQWPWMAVRNAFAAPEHVWLSSLFVLVFAAASVVLFRRGLRIEAVYVAASCAFVLETGAIVSGPRYTAVLFPVFFLIGEAMRRSRPVRWGYAALGSAALLFETVKFSLGYWVS